jgi:hypothetical protein
MEVREIHLFFDESHESTDEVAKIFRVMNRQL